VKSKANVLRLWRSCKLEKGSVMWLQLSVKTRPDKEDPLDGRLGEPWWDLSRMLLLPFLFQPWAILSTPTLLSRQSLAITSLWSRGRNKIVKVKFVNEPFLQMVLFLFQEKMSNSTSKTYKFDALFLKRFFQLHKFFFPRPCSCNSSVFVLLLVTSGLGRELSYILGSSSTFVLLNIVLSILWINCPVCELYQMYTK